MQMAIVEQGNADQAQQAARRAGQLLAAGRLVVFPTETVYGIGAAATSKAGYRALCRFKNRPRHQPFTIHLPQAAAAERYVDTGIPMVRRLISKTLPGPVTLVIEVTNELIEAKLKALNMPVEMRDRLYHKNTVGLRCPDHPIAQHVLEATEGPVIASSANARNEPPPLDAEEAAVAVGDAAELIIDGGRTEYSKPSTIVRVRSVAGGAPKVSVERAGVYDERFVRKLLRWTMLIVCSGNTCRSPMAQAIATKMLAEQRGVGARVLEDQGIQVQSAGTFATTGMPASPEAVEAMGKIGIDLSTHRSRALMPELIHEADVIYTMTDTHRQVILSMIPSATDKTFTLDPNGDVDDPLGSGPTGYQRCAELIRRQLVQRLKEQQP